MVAYGIFPDGPAAFADVPSFVASMAPAGAIQVIISPQLKDFAAELFPGAGSDAGGGMVSYEVVDVAAVLAGCTMAACCLGVGLISVRGQSADSIYNPRIL